MCMSHISVCWIPPGPYDCTGSGTASILQFEAQNCIALGCSPRPTISDTSPQEYFRSNFTWTLHSAFLQCRLSDCLVQDYWQHLKAWARPLRVHGMFTTSRKLSDYKERMGHTCCMLTQANHFQSLLQVHGNLSVLRAKLKFSERPKSRSIAWYSNHKAAAVLVISILT